MSLDRPGDRGIYRSGVVSGRQIARLSVCRNPLDLFRLYVFVLRQETVLLPFQPALIDISKRYWNAQNRSD